MVESTPGIFPAMSKIKKRISKNEYKTKPSINSKIKSIKREKILSPQILMFQRKIAAFRIQKFFKSHFSNKDEQILEKNFLQEKISKSPRMFKYKTDPNILLREDLSLIRIDSKLITPNEVSKIYSSNSAIFE